MNVKANYFKMSKEEFTKFLLEIKSAHNTIFLLDRKYFFTPSIETTNSILELNKKMFELDSIINSFTDFSKRQIIQSFLIEEIGATNRIENIHSTKHDILSIITKASSSKDKKIISISNEYSHLLKSNGTKINDLSDIRNLYEIILKDSISINDLPDGKYFRKEPVYISNGIKSIHKGVTGEDNINKLMNEFIELYNSKNEIFTKMILCHFIFEFIHPFYDGNGRISRFLFSNGLFLETNSYFSFIIASSFEHNKNDYYKAFKYGDDKYEFGCLNEFFLQIVDILLKEINIVIKKLNDDKKKINEYNVSFKLTKSEEKIFKVIKEASILSTFDVSNEEIMQETHVSKEL